jgi:hypothetical protein
MLCKDTMVVRAEEVEVISTGNASKRRRRENGAKEGDESINDG